MRSLILAVVIAAVAADAQAQSVPFPDFQFPRMAPATGGLPTAVDVVVAGG